MTIPYFRVSVCWHLTEPTPEHRPFIPTPLQDDILDALDGKSLRTDALAHRADCNRRSLFHRQGGLPELQAVGLVAWHRRIGYYRPDAPPADLPRVLAVPKAA